MLVKYNSFETFSSNMRELHMFCLMIQCLLWRIGPILCSSATWTCQSTIMIPGLNNPVISQKLVIRRETYFFSVYNISQAQGYIVCTSIRINAYNNSLICFHVHPPPLHTLRYSCPLQNYLLSSPMKCLALCQLTFLSSRTMNRQVYYDDCSKVFILFPCMLDKAIIAK